MGNPRTIQITLPVPKRLLTPNARLHWAVRAQHAKAQREVAYWHGFEAMHRFPPGDEFSETMALLDGEYFCPGTSVRMDIEVRPYPRMKRLDDDNFWAAMKHYRDGLADAGIVENDSQFVIGTLTWSPERTGQLVLTLVEVG